MEYDLKNRIDQDKAKTRIAYLFKHEKTIEVTQKRKVRSISQNNYMYLVLSAFGLEFGYTLFETKQYIFKETVNSEIFNDGFKYNIVTIPHWRSTADLNTKEMTTAIDRFLNYSAEQGFRLPEPDDLIWLREIKQEVEANKQYL